MELIVGKATACQRKMYGSDYISDIAAGKTITIETSPQGQDILNVTVPEGEKWDLKIVIDIISTKC